MQLSAKDDTFGQTPKVNMRRIVIALYGLFACLSCLSAQSVNNYQSLDPTDPIVFGGDHIVYKNQKITLGNNAFFLDGNLADEVAGQYPYVFNTLQSALEALSDGTEGQPMVLYMAPWVYWVDDPDDPEVRKPNARFSGAPVGAEVECEWLRFYGLTEDPVNVVLAGNRGQTHGAEGNFTLFNIRGNGVSAENVTFGNYCNIDLEFPLNPELNRRRRADAIVQAQLVFSNADKAWARNTRFISRLNLCPFSGARRLLFDRCYFECTDDALAGTGVYLDSKFVFYSSKPFYSTKDDGAVFLNCDFEIRTHGRQYFTKSDTPVAVVDSRFLHTSDDLYIGWSGAPRQWVRGYQYNVTLNGKPYSINSEAPYKTVDLTEKPLLNAYRIEYNGEIIYNTYNLLRGNDGWDPMGVRERITAAGKATGKDYTDIPVYLRITPPAAEIVSGDSSARFEASVYRKAMFPIENPAVTWSIPQAGKEIVAIRPDQASLSCEVTGTNRDEVSHEVLLTARTPDGLEGAARVTVLPSYLEPPAFREDPRIERAGSGQLRIVYSLNLGVRADQSQVTWYRCSDKDGSDPIEVAVSRLDEPLLLYTLTPGDAGHYIMATVAPKHARSHTGEALSVVYPVVIRERGIESARFFSTDFKNFPTANQPEILPGTWTVGGFKPTDTDYYSWLPVTDKENWSYSEGIDGAAGIYGLTQIAKGARMLYTPVEGTYGDMTIEITAAPGKSAAQGFGSATGQYMDVFIQYDTRTLTGYGLRIIRTNKYGDAVDFILMKYKNGVSEELTEPVSSDVYRTTCTIRLAVRGGKLSADVTTDAAPRRERPEIVPSVRLQADIVPASFGGLGIQHTGSTGAGATWLRSMNIYWK